MNHDSVYVVSTRLLPCITAALITTLVSPLAAAPAKTDQIESYLSSHSLDELLALHLQRVFQTSSGTDRQDAADKLASLYARQLTSGASLTAHDELVTQSKSILAVLPDARALELRLALAQDAFTHAEDQAERWRLQLADHTEADTARRTCTDLVKQLSTIAENADVRIRSLERQEETLGRTDLLADALEQARRQRSRAHYLAGWAGYYVAELDPGSRAGASGEALRHFGAMLNARPDAAPTVPRVPEQMLEFDHVARSAIGSGLCVALQGNTVQALQWLDLVRHSTVAADAIKAQVPARRIIVLAQSANWDALAAFMNRLQSESTLKARQPGPSGLTATEARLLAVYAMDGTVQNHSHAAQTLAQRALAALAIDGNTAQLLDIAEKYLTLTADTQRAGFLSSYLRGLREYNRAQQLLRASGNDLDTPSTDISITRPFRSASQFFNRATKADDAVEFSLAASSAELLQAIALFSSAANTDDLIASVDMLTRAGASLHSVDPTRAASAYRLAIRALELALDRNAPNATAIATRRNQLVDRFIDLYPTNPAAAGFIIRRATAEDVPTDRAVSLLLSIPENSPLALNAHHEAARRLYAQFAQANGPDRQNAATRFLSVADGLLAHDRRQIMSGDRTEAARAALNARRILECEFVLNGPSVSRAARAYDLLSALFSQGVLTDTGVHVELQYRAVQIALLKRDIKMAMEAASKLAKSNPTLAAQAHRAILFGLARTWEHNAPPADLSSPSSADPSQLRAAHDLYDFAVDHLALNEPLQRERNAHGDAALLAVIADAGAFLWQYEHTDDVRKLTLMLYQSLLASQGDAARILQASARFFESANERTLAIESLSRLLKGLDEGTDEWFQTKGHLISLLATVDPARARQLIEQHAVLYPEFGPPPWGARLRTLHKQLTAGGGDPP